MLDLTRIVVTSPMPIHPYLSRDALVAVKIMGNGEVWGKTPFVDGDPLVGKWELESKLSSFEIDQLLTIVVVVKKKGREKEFVISTIGILDLMLQVIHEPKETYTFSTSNYSIDFTITCSITLPGYNSASAHGDIEEEDSPLPSRDDLESIYATTTALSDQNTRAKALSALGKAYRQLFSETHWKKDLETAISLSDEAVRLTSPHDPQAAERLSVLTGALEDSFKQYDNIGAIEIAIEHLQTALGTTADDENRSKLLQELSIQFHRRFVRLDTIEDLNQAISFMREALSFCPLRHEDRPHHFHVLGNVLKDRLKRSGTIKDLDESIMHLHEAVRLASDENEDKPSYLSSLGNALGNRFELLSRVTDIDDAIASQQRAVELTADGDTRKPSWLSNLGISFETRFGRFGNLQDIESAISCLRRAVAIMTERCTEKSHIYTTLGNVLRERYNRQGILADLEEAVSSQSKGVEFTLDGHSDMPSRLNNLASALKDRFKRLGHIEDLEDAISSQRKAAELAPNGHPDKAQILNNLGAFYRTRFERFKTATDADSAVFAYRQAIELLPAGDPREASWLYNLGMAILSKSDSSRLNVLEEAISLMRKAAKQIPDGHPQAATIFEGLAFSLGCRFDHFNIQVDLDEAISNYSTAIRFTLADHPSLPFRLNHLANALYLRFLKIGKDEDMEISLSHHRKAVELVPQTDPGGTKLLCDLAKTLVHNFERSDSQEDIKDVWEALSAISIATALPMGPPTLRLQAARQWATMAQSYDKGGTMTALKHAIDLLPRIAWLGLSLSDQHTLLAEFGDIVRDAVGVAILYGEYEIAIEWAEQGRSIVWQNLLGLRSPVDELRISHSGLADRLQNISRKIESPQSLNDISEETNVVPTEDVAQRSSQLAIEWENTIEEIRKIPKFASFLEAKSFSELAPVSHEGPVVVLNVQRSRCDALILTSDEIKQHMHVPLVHFTSELSESLFVDMKKLLSVAGVRARSNRKSQRVKSSISNSEKFEKILGELWVRVVKPVIDCLGYPVNLENPPRIWWCTSGFLSFLPIHAAGLYKTGGVGDKVTDYVVSSYTPTLTAILDQHQPVIPRDFRILTVAQPKTPYASPLPNTEDEVNRIEHLAGNISLEKLTGEGATKDCVLQAMKRSHWVHLACHGQQDISDPMKSGLLLHDKMLELSELVQHSFPNSDFAFLSACQTGMGDEKVAEESAHLAAGMFLAGFRGVIATMWSINDADAPQVAEDVYRRMLKGGKPRRKEAAYALHEAVKNLRESGADYISWVPFIHFGR